MLSGLLIIRILLVLLLCSSVSIAEAAHDSSPAWKDAITAYKAGEFEKAVERFKKIAEDEKQISAALCHNIANSEYKRGEETAASIWYRRALALDRRLPEAQQNLRFLHRKAGFHRFEPRGMVKFAALFPRRHWVAACQIATWTAVLTAVWLVWAPPRPGRRWPLVTLLCLAVASIVTAACGLAGKRVDDAPLTKRLISISKDAVARSAPAEAAGSVIALPPGSELFPVREEGFWTYCDIPGGEENAPLRGWVRTATTERLWPWAPSLVE